MKPNKICKTCNILKNTVSYQFIYGYKNSQILYLFPCFFSSVMYVAFLSSHKNYILIQVVFTHYTEAYKLKIPILELKIPPLKLEISRLNLKIPTLKLDFPILKLESQNNFKVGNS